MAVAAKKRRKITYKNKQYIWYVIKDEDFFDRDVLHIISADKKLILSYPVASKLSYVVSKGHYFQNNKTDGCYKRYLMPLNSVFKVTPKFVLEVIDWAWYGKDAQMIKFDGKDVWL